MTNNELECAAVRLNVRRHWRKTQSRPTTMAERLQAARMAAADVRYAIEGRLRGWR